MRQIVTPHYQLYKFTSIVRGHKESSLMFYSYLIRQMATARHTLIVSTFYCSRLPCRHLTPQPRAFVITKGKDGGYEIISASTANIFFLVFLSLFFDFLSIFFLFFICSFFSWFACYFPCFFLSFFSTCFEACGHCHQYKI